MPLLPAPATNTCHQHLPLPDTLPTAAYAATQHPDYSLLAGRIAMSNLHKMTKSSFLAVAEELGGYIHPETGKPAPLMAADVLEIVRANAERLEAAIDYERDLQFDFFAFKTLERSYLLKTHDKVAERPQHMYMRVALGIHKDDIEAALETYELMSTKVFTHATPTLFNAGTPRPQLSSCFLLQMQDDSIHGIYDTLKQCAVISKYAGGIGLSIHNIRAKGSYIGGTNGHSNGIVPMLKVFNDSARYVDQGGGKRKGSIAVYLEPWHADVEDFLDLKKNHGKEEQRARDLFYALWIPDLFMKRVKEDGEWSLFCPNEAPGLPDCWGAEFEELYTRYEREGKARGTVRAQALWFKILQSQIETGTPYLLYKDAANSKSNQQHLGTIRSSNLCTEVMEYTSPDEVAVCNLASIALPKFVRKADDGSTSFDFEGLVSVAKVATRNLNKVIDLNFYPVEEARRSNMRHRPIGLGVQGLADTFAMMRLPFESAEARALNRDIFEALYYGSVNASCELAEAQGAYETYEGSPASQGKLQFDLWGVTPSARWNWAELKERIARFGMRNSLLVAPMPTASTAQILGNNESIEPFTSNMYNRRVLAGEFAVVNKHMLRDLTERGLWTAEVRNQIMADGGSIQRVASIPDDLKALYKTVWEIKQRTVIDMSADRGAFVCQSQSLNLHLPSPTMSQLSSMHFYAWSQGLKTGQYYLRSKPKADAIQFTVDQAMLAKSRSTAEAPADGAAVASKTAAPVTPAKATRSALAGNVDPSPAKDPGAEEAIPMVCRRARRGETLAPGEECLMCGS